MVSIGKELVENLSTLSKEDKKWLENLIIEFNEDTERIIREIDSQYNPNQYLRGYSYRENIREKLDQRRTTMRMEVNRKFKKEEKKLLGAFAYMVLDRKYFQKHEDMNNSFTYKITTPDTAYIANELNGVSIVDYFKARNCKETRNFLIQNINLLPSSTQKYVKTKIKEQQQSSSLEKITDPFQYAIFESELLEKPTKSSLKSILKIFHNLPEESYLITMTYVLKGFLSKYKNKKGMEDIFKELQAKIRIGLTAALSMNSYRQMILTSDITIAQMIKESLDIMREDEEVATIVLKMYEHDHSHSEAEFIAYMLEDSITTEENKELVLKYEEERIKSKLLDQNYYNYSEMTEEERNVFKEVKRRQYKKKKKVFL